MRILLPLILAAAVSACAQSPVQTLDQKRQRIMEWRDQKARNLDGVPLDSRWPGGRADELDKWALFELGKYYAAGKFVAKQGDYLLEIELIAQRVPRGRNVKN